MQCFPSIKYTNHKNPKPVKYKPAAARRSVYQKKDTQNYAQDDFYAYEKVRISEDPDRREYHS